MFRFRTLLTCLTPIIFISLNGCSNTGALPQATTRASLTTDVNDYQYLI
ncbi:MAG: sugar ABC transporter substrate-binding protein, partial [Pseudomonadota bacterium]|nr:sugar ABC transporter substrate-binding protein [Pseudomonadota bacterium]